MKPLHRPSRLSCVGFLRGRERERERERERVVHLLRSCKCSEGSNAKLLVARQALMEAAPIMPKNSRGCPTLFTVLPELEIV